MSVRFQYNKTSLHQLNKQLQVRIKALPTLKNKESALRLEVKKSKNELVELENKLEDLISSENENMRMWNEFDSELVEVDKIVHNYKKIAGIKTPELDKLTFIVKEFFIFGNPKWYLDGVEVLKTLITLVYKKKIVGEKVEMLVYARKKTTQKVNLYEKVQIPDHETAILKIKRFLEDEENLSKASQKIIKLRHQQSEGALI